MHFISKQCTAPESIDSSGRLLFFFLYFLSFCFLEYIVNTISELDGVCTNAVLGPIYYS